MPTSAKVAVLSVDPQGLSTFTTFDPDSHTVISSVCDSLIVIDNDGQVQPALATAWRRVSETVMEFDLRRGVRFHDGSPFTADDVVATFDAHFHPTPSPAGQGFFALIAAVDRVDDYTVRIRTAVPDVLLLRRLFFSNIYPRHVLQTQGRGAVEERPIGTGPFRFVRYARGREIVLQRNPDHWSGAETVDELRLPILRQKEWVDRLATGQVDIALNLDSHDRVRAERIDGLNVASRPAAITQWFLLSHQGALSDLRVRRALNHAVNRRLLVEVTSHGLGRPQSSIASEEQVGFTACEPFRYSPETARRLLQEAGYDAGLRLRGIVGETSTAVYFTVREFLSRVGVSLEAEIVPRSEWIARMSALRDGDGQRRCDFAVGSVDNPVLHSIFPQYVFCYSEGPMALARDAAYDDRFLHAASTVDPDASRVALAELERDARDRAMVLFTMHEHVHAAFRGDFRAELPRTGAIRASTLVSIRADTSVTPVQTLPPGPRPGDAKRLLEGTSHTGTFFLPGGATFEDGSLQRVWHNLQTAEERWRLENEPMVRELVNHAEARAHLSNVLGSTERVAIAGYSHEGRCMFVNSGYAGLFGQDVEALPTLLKPRWVEMRDAVATHGSWAGLLRLPRAADTGDPKQLHLSVSRAVDDEGLDMGHTFVLSDFSGEEERIRHQAIRAILDHVPYGLFMCDSRGRLLSGYSDTCAAIFADSGNLQGKELAALLQLNPREAGHFRAAYEQVFDDLLPEQVSLQNLPERVVLRDRTYSLSAAVVRGPEGAVESVIVTLMDISDLVAAELEQQRLRGVVQVMRYRDPFADFARQLHAQLQALSAHTAGDGLEGRARRLLHTAKGVLGQFGQTDLAREIHAMEDRSPLSGRDLLELDRRLVQRVEHNRDVWGIDLEAGAARYSVAEQQLLDLEARIRGAANAEGAVAAALAGLQRLRERTAGEYLGPLAERCAAQAERQGKCVALHVDGTQVPIPLPYVEVFDVLPHLLRNSIDHGIEPQTERGDKPATATIELGIQSNDNGLSIRVRDDGRGIQAERLRARALSQGLYTAAELDAMTPEQCQQLIFAEGLSTAREVTRTSGRGVGMAAVRATVQGLGGTLSLHSEPDRGTEFVIELPRLQAS